MQLLNHQQGIAIVKSKLWSVQDFLDLFNYRQAEEKIMPPGDEHIKY